MSSQNPITFTMPSSSVSVSAQFSVATVLVTVTVLASANNSPIAGATVTVTGPNNVSASATTNSSGQASFQLTPGYTYNFNASATGYLSGGTSQYISGPTNVKIVLTGPLETLTVSASQGGDVVVTVNGTDYGTVSAGSSKSFNVPVGATVELTAQPASGYVFEGWSGVP
ncbi:MAG: carboxypeptidase-like regulatory domain-containing protein [Conexivisphaera sp.]